MSKQPKPKTPLEEAGKDHGWKEEEFEDFNGVYVKTDYPEPTKKFKIVYESFTLSMEETYFWILNALQYDFSFPQVDKVTDIFSSAENSSIFGQASQRLGIQQDRITGTLATVGKMVKDLFALVRELRIIDERITTYDAWNKHKSKSSDATLKQHYIDFVESQGGQTKPSSVYGLAQNLGYTSLPDYFFNTRVFKKEDVDKIVDSLATNNNLKNVLRRKLFEFLVWKEEVEKETRHRRKFTLQYLRQQWATIKMYMGWLKPYLRNVKRLSMNEKSILGPDIISAFETAALEIEILAYHPNRASGGDSPCILVNFKYFVKPSLSYQQPESYQRGPIHVGRVEISFRSYGWSKSEIETYKKYREKQEMDLLAVVDSSLKAAMDALSEDLERYLAEAGEDEFKKKAEDKVKEKEKKEERTFFQKFFNVREGAKAAGDSSAAEPFVAVFMGFGEIMGSFLPSGITDKKSGAPKAKKGGKEASKVMMLLWKNYKKSHQLLTW
ncbi:MAG TPA: hypothetical protein VEC16_02815 [Alphaproteobacteria bacterium]|nr:hypothetical protein [Alphaproteobacteria bacterium]